MSPGAPAAEYRQGFGTPFVRPVENNDAAPAFLAQNIYRGKSNRREFPQVYARIGGALYLAIIVLGAFAEGFVADKGI